jgi:DNA gyrase subunit A
MRTTLEQVRVIGRNSQGVKIINLKDKEKVSSFTIAPKAEEEASVPEENINEASMPHDDLSDEDASTTDETSDETKDV